MFIFNVFQLITRRYYAELARSWIEYGTLQLHRKNALSIRVHSNQIICTIFNKDEVFPRVVFFFSHSQFQLRKGKSFINNLLSVQYFAKHRNERNHVEYSFINEMCRNVEHETCHEIVSYTAHTHTHTRTPPSTKHMVSLTSANLSINLSQFRAACQTPI